MSRKYCLNTPKRKMGFSQKASCKAQGLLKRTSKKNKGKYIVSRKYKKSRRKYDGSARKRVNKSLYSNGNKKPKIKSGYGSQEKAKQTLKNLKGYNKLYQYQVINTMYNRAKFHANQTQGMRDAMKIYKKWLNNEKNKRNKKSKRF